MKTNKNSKSNIGILDAYNVIFEEKFELDNFNIDAIVIDSCTYHKKFELSQNRVEKMEITNTIFKDVTILDECVFGSSDKKIKTLFKNTTFKGYSVFKNLEFLSELDISSSSFTNEVDFLNIGIETDLSEKETNSETFRRIKNSLDKVGNHIEANKFYADEMTAYKKVLQDQKGHIEDRFIFWLSRQISNHGQSFLKPIYWILFTAIIANAINVAYGYHYELLVLYNGSWIDIVSNYINLIFTSIPAVSYLLGKPSYEFTPYIIRIFYYIINICLIWQTTTALKRKVRR